MKNILRLLPILFLVACASTPESTKQSTPDYSPVEVETSPAKTGSAKSEAKSEAKAKMEAEFADVPVRENRDTSPYAQLSEAVRVQSDDRMYQVASGILMDNPQDMRALNVMAMYHYKKGRFELAEYLMRKAISVNSVTGELHNNLGVILLAKNERRAAIQSFRKALELNMDDAVAAANAGAFYVVEKDYSKARIALETAYKRGVRDPKIMNSYAVALAAGGKNDQAADLYEAILKNNSNDRETLFNYATLLIEGQKKYSEGLDVISRLKFVGGLAESRSRINALENKAKAGLK